MRKRRKLKLETKDDLIKSMDRFNNKYRLVAVYTSLVRWRAPLDPDSKLSYYPAAAAALILSNPL